MSQLCSKCGDIVYRARIDISTGERIGYDCGCVRRPVELDHDNPFRNDGELVLQHIADENGNPVRVTSRRQLQEAEQRYDFNHVPTNMSKGNWDSPKQQKFYTVGDLYERKFGRGQA